MSHSAATFTTEIQAGVTLEDQYDLLSSFNVSPCQQWLSRGLSQQRDSLKVHPGELSRRPSTSSCSSTSSRFSVDLLSTEGVAILTEETIEQDIDDVDSDAGLHVSMDEEVHVSIDEEDDDVYFSVHKSEVRDFYTECSDETSPVHCPEDVAVVDPVVARKRGSVVSVHADIDEEDDDIFFSLHQENDDPDATTEASESSNESSPQGCQDDVAGLDHVVACEPVPAASLHADTDDEEDDTFLPLSAPMAKLQEDDKDPSSIPEASDVSTECSDHACLEDVAAFDLVVAPVRQLHQQTVTKTQIFEHDACEPVVVGILRPVVSVDVTVAAEAAVAPGLLANLKGGRAQGVRNFLARKFTPEIIADDDDEVF